MLYRINVAALFPLRFIFIQVKCPNFSWDHFVKHAELKCGFQILIDCSCSVILSCARIYLKIVNRYFFENPVIICLDGYVMMVLHCPLVAVAQR